MNTSRKTNVYYPDKKLGLALGGGGARGMAHIGILKAFEEAGLTIDAIAGSSIGGFLAAMYAAGLSPARLETEALQLTQIRNFVRLLGGVAAPAALVETSRIRAYLENLLGVNTTFDNLPIPLSLTAVDLSTGQEVVLNEGSLVTAALATIAVPGLFPEVKIGDYELIDGGILNNLPVEVVRKMGADVVVAIDVNPQFPRSREDTAEEVWPGFIPHFAKDFYRAELIMVSYITRVRLQSAPPDVIIQPVLPSQISIFWGFQLCSEAIARGKQAGEKAVGEIRKKLLV